jgi:transcriptional regulator with XRE-family HTH domain
MLAQVLKSVTVMSNPKEGGLKMPSADRTLGRMIEEQRAITGETQAAAAKKMGMDRGTLIRYESDRTYPVVLMRYRLAQWLGIGVDELPPPVAKTPETAS